MVLLNENTSTIQLFLFILSVAILWKNLPEWRTPRQTEEGIFHRWLAARWRSVVLAAAWWHDSVSGVSGGFFDFMYVPLRRLFGHELAYPVANFFSSRVLSFFTFHWLVWLVAKDHLQAKWQVELDQANFEYRQSKCQFKNDKGQS